MVDVSSNAGNANFKLVLEFAKSIFHYFIRGDKVRFGLVKCDNNDAEVYLFPSFILIYFVYVFHFNSISQDTFTC